MIVSCTLDYYIIYVIFLKITIKGKGWYIICKKKKQIDNINDNKNVDKFGFVASLT